MTSKQKFFGLFLIMVGLLFSQASHAAVTPTIQASAAGGDAVQVTISGEPDSAIQLSFWAPGSATASTIVFGTTSVNGAFSTTISSGGYGIPANSPVFVTVAGRQSAWISWPNYTSDITLNKNSLQIAIGQSVIVNASNAIILAANSLNSLASVTISGSQATITGLQNGFGSLTMCGAGVGCATLAVEIGAAGQTEVSFNENNLTIKESQSKDITIFGSSRNGYFIKTNSNAAALEASISGNSNIISLFGTHTLGNATVVVCSVEDDKNCASLYVTVLDNTAAVLTFSQNDLTVAPGLQKIVTVSGGPNANYYVAANTNSGVAVATLSGTALTITGGSNAGSTTIKVCSTTANATCGDLSITCTLNNNNPSATAIAFSQNVVAVFVDDASNVTMSGGSGGYTISANSEPSKVSATIASGSNIINLRGLKEGSSIVTVCAAANSATCASLYVNVNPASVQITFSQNNVSLKSGSTSIISINGASGEKTLKSNSHASAVSASLNNAGNILLLTGGASAGTANITVCAKDNDNNCATLIANNSQPEVAGAKISDSTAAPISADDQLQQISANVSSLLSAVSANARQAAESYLVKLVGAMSNVSTTILDTMGKFISEGTSTTLKMGAGERAGAIGSYHQAFGYWPESQSDWSDVIKIANGRWPTTESASALASAKTEFVKVYDRQPNMSNANDNAAVSIIAYGLRPTARNLDSEKAAIKTFRWVYSHDPLSSLAWDIVRAIAYSGAKR